MCTESERSRQYQEIYEESLDLIDEWQEQQNASLQSAAPVSSREYHPEVHYHDGNTTTIHQTNMYLGTGSGAIRLRLITTLAVLALAAVLIAALSQAVLALLPVLIMVLHILVLVLAVVVLLAVLGAVVFGVLHVLPALLTLWERVAAWRACRQSAARPHEVAHEQDRRYR